MRSWVVAMLSVWVALAGCSRERERGALLVRVDLADADPSERAGLVACVCRPEDAMRKVRDDSSCFGSMLFPSIAVAGSLDGLFVFSGLAPGEYLLRVCAPRDGPRSPAVQVRWQRWVTVGRATVDLGRIELAPPVDRVVCHAPSRFARSNTTGLFVYQRLDGRRVWRGAAMSLHGAAVLRGLTPGTYEVAPATFLCGPTFHPGRAVPGIEPAQVVVHANGDVTPLLVTF